MAKIRLSQSRLILGLTAGLLVILAMIVAWSLANQSSDVVPDTTKQKTVEESHLEITALVDEGDIDGALQQYDEAISRQGDKSKKKELLLLKSDLASRSGRTGTAIDAAQKAEEIEPDATVAQSLATAYELNGDKENAIIYYKKIIELTPEDSPGSRYVGIWQAKIKELEQ